MLFVVVIVVPENENFVCSWCSKSSSHRRRRRLLFVVLFASFRLLFARRFAEDVCVCDTVCVCELVVVCVCVCVRL